MKNISDVIDETFQALVVERSREVPVLVDFWAEWCGPCQMLMPILKKLTEEYDGKFVLAKVNTDDQQQLAKTHGIRSLPTLHVYKHGERVEEILAAQSEATLRILLDRYIERPSNRIRDEARELFQQGRHDDALSLLEAACQEEPDNHQLALDYAELCMRCGELDRADATIAALPRDVRDETEANRLRKLLEFAITGKSAPDIAALESTISGEPDNMKARYQLGAQYVLSDRFEEALETFMQMFESDRSFQEDAARKSLVSIFELLNNEGELVTRYRRKLFNLLH